MQCEKYLNLIDDLIEGELDEQTSRQVNLHVFACSECGAHYEKLKQEKEIFAYYLFNAEPSNDLWAKLETKLDAEIAAPARSAKILAVINGWKENFFELRRFAPALACAALILTLGIGFVLFNFFANRSVPAGDNLAGKQPLAEEIKRAETGNPTIKVKEEKDTDSPKKAVTGNRPSSAKSKRKTEIKSAAVKETKIKKKDFPEARLANSAQIAHLNEEQLQIKRIENLETEAAKQVEKIELLLRSFRNARSAEDGDAYDVAYEKEQARKLLEKNVRLRRDAETFGSFYTTEVLSRVEPYLLDIANLETNPSSDKVRDIKDRVKNQNIIASLQIY